MRPRRTCTGGGQAGPGRGPVVRLPFNEAPAHMYRGSGRCGKTATPKRWPFNEAPAHMYRGRGGFEFRPRPRERRSMRPRRTCTGGDTPREVNSAYAVAKPSARSGYLRGPSIRTVPIPTRIVKQGPLGRTSRQCLSTADGGFGRTEAVAPTVAERAAGGFIRPLPAVLEPGRSCRGSPPAAPLCRPDRGP